jgi:hypothetical protein
VRRTRRPEGLTGHAAVPLERGALLAEWDGRAAAPRTAYARLDLPHDGGFDAPEHLAHLIVPGFKVRTPRCKPSFRDSHQMLLSPRNDMWQFSCQSSGFGLWIIDDLEGLE